MIENEFNQFKSYWTAYANIINPTTTLNDVALLIIFRKLMPYSLSQVTKAMDTLSGRSDIFALNIADVLNELKGFNKDEIRERANIAFDTVLSVVSYPGTYYSYIFEDVAIDHTLYALGWDMNYLNSEQCNPVFSKKDFVAQYMISAQKADKLKHLVLKGGSTADNHTRLVSADKVRYGNPVTWVLSEADKETILLGNEDSDNAVKRITAELPKIPQLPEEKKADTSVPAPIKEQMAALEQTFESFGV